MSLPIPPTVCRIWFDGQPTYNTDPKGKFMLADSWLLADAVLIVSHGGIVGRHKKRVN